MYIRAVMLTKYFLLLALGLVISPTTPQEVSLNYPVRFTTGEDAESASCPNTHTRELRESIQRDMDLLIDERVVPMLLEQTQTREETTGSRACGCGGPGWQRVAYLNTSDATQSCPGNWSLISTPRRTCGRSTNAGSLTCNSVTFNVQDTEYSEVCGRIIGYQFGSTGAFYAVNSGHYNSFTINDPYVNGVSLTYGNPRQHVWTFVAAFGEYNVGYRSACPCTDVNYQNTAVIPSYVGNDYFCETGVPPNQHLIFEMFYADDPLWDGQGCGPTSTCCSFNNPPWFCKRLPQSTSDDLEIRACGYGDGSRVNTPVELVELYVK